jgi:hypothetical protein
MGAHIVSSAPVQLGADLLAVPPMQAVFNISVGWIAASVCGGIAI